MRRFGAAACAAVLAASVLALVPAVASGASDGPETSAQSPLGQPEGEAEAEGGVAQSVVLTATVENRLVTLALTGAGAPSSWWFRINWWGSCTPVTGTTVSGIGGYEGGPHSVWAHSDSGCGSQIASAEFTVVDPTLTATVNDDRSVALSLANGPADWWFRIGSGTCTAGPADSIRGYAAGLWGVAAFGDSSCATYLTETIFTIADATLTATVNSDHTVDLALTGGPSDWWFRINWWGTCTQVTGTEITGIAGYKSGPYAVNAYSDSGCSYHVASSSFTIPTAALTATVNSDWSVDLALTGAPSNWWFRINWWGTCTPASGTDATGIRGYRSGTHVVTVFTDGNCGSSGSIAGAEFVIPAAALTATVKDNRVFDLTLTNGPANWWFRINSWGTCTPASGATASDISGYAVGEYDVWAYADSNCTWRVTPLTFALTAKPAQPAAPTLTPGNASLTAAWTAPGSGDSPITDYDVRYRATGATDWESAPANLAVYSPGDVGDMAQTSVIDLGTVALTGLTVTKLANSVYKITEAVDSLRVKVSATNGASGPSRAWRARYHSSAPSDRWNDGTAIWGLSAGAHQDFTGDGTAFSLPANTHFWVVADHGFTYTDDVTPTIAADRIAVPATLSVGVTGLTNGTEYEVQVRAANGIGESAWSPSGTLKAGLPAQPAAPALVAGNTELDVTWAAPSGNGADVTDYDLRYSSDSGATWTETADTTDSTATTATITGLTNNTSYVVQVRAGNTHGDGAWSPSSAALAPRSAPDAPSAPTLTAGARQLTAAWTAPNAHTLTITDYDVQYRKSAETDWEDWAHTGTAVTATLTGLDGAVTYQVRVRAESSVGEGAWSPAASLATTADKPEAPDAPTLVSGTGQITVDWGAPYDGGSAITDYDLQYCSTGCSTASNWTFAEMNAMANTARSYIIGSLTSGTSYQVQVRATNAQGDSPWSATAATVLGAPGRVVATVQPGNGQIVLSWTAPADHGNAISDYDMRYRQVGAGSWTSISDGGSLGSGHVTGSDTATATDNPINFGALGNGIVSEATSGGHYGLYKVPNAIDRMRIYLGAYDTGTNDPEFELRTAATKPTDLSGGTLLATSSSRSFTEWVGPIAANGYFWAVPTSGPRSYGIRYRAIHHIDLASTATTYTLGGLTNGTTWEVSVQAANSIGAGQWSAPVSATPGLPLTPAAPTLAAANQRLAVSWTAVSGNGSAVTDYDLRYSSDSGTTWTETADTADSTATTATITGLTNNTAYVVQVRAGNANGDGAWSPSSASGTPVPVPDAPAAPTLTTGNASLGVEWAAPADSGSAITDYDMRYRAAGATDWNGYYIRHARYSRSGAGHNSKQSHGPTGVALDLGTVTLSGLTVTKESGNVYKIAESVGALRVKLSARNSKSGQTVTYVARYASSAPGNSMNTHGTELWQQSVTYPNSLTADADATATTGLTGPVYFWITTTTLGLTDIVAPTIEAEAVVGVPSTLTSTISRLTNGTSYEVQLRAANAHGAGAWSPSGTIKAGLPARATAPTLVSANTQLAASWAAVAGNGSSITDYDVRYSSDGGATWTETADTTDSTTTSATITGLTNGTAYLMQVRAGNTHGDGLWSPSSASTQAGAPEPPAAPTLTPAAGQLTVTWAAPTDSGSAITDYDLQYCSADCTTTGIWTFVEGGTSTSTTAAITGLTDNVAYQVQVRATNARGDSAWSPATTASTLTAVVTSSSATLTIARGSHSGNWHVKKTAPATPAGTCSSAISGTTHSLALTANTTYTYTAYSDSGCTTVIALITFTTLQSTLTASNVSNTSATLTIGSDHTGSWYLKETSPATDAACSGEITGTSRNVTSLTDGAPHVYHAYSDSGCTTAIARGTFTTTLYPPTDFSTSKSCGWFSCDFSLSWSQNSSTTGSVGYQVQKKELSSNWSHEAWTNSTSYSDTAIEGTVYRVRAYRTTSGVTVYSPWVE